MYTKIRKWGKEKVFLHTRWGKVAFNFLGIILRWNVYELDWHGSEKFFRKSPSRGDTPPHPTVFTQTVPWGLVLLSLWNKTPIRMAFLLGHSNSQAGYKLRLARRRVGMGALAPLTLSNPEVQMLRKESKSCLRTPAQGRWKLPHHGRALTCRGLSVQHLPRNLCQEMHPSSPFVQAVYY